jgi:hypothetical protein
LPQKNRDDVTNNFVIMMLMSDQFTFHLVGRMSFITSITKGRKKTPEQLVRLAARDLSDLDADQTAAELRAGISPHEDLCKRLSQIKVILYGDGDKADVDEEKVIDVSRRIQDVCDH